MKPHSAFASHLPLVLFTWAMLAAAGLALGAALGAPAGLMPWAFGLVAAGAAASFLHLGRKARAAGSLRGLRHSWISREALLSALFAAGLAAGCADGRLLWPAALLGLALACAIVRIYALDAQPFWRAWPNAAAPLVAVAALGAAAGRQLPALLVLGVLDLGLLGLRFRLLRRPWPGLAVAFPALRGAAAAAFGPRLLATLAALGCAAAGEAGAALLGLAAALLLDRFIFYAAARQHAPSARIAELKAIRMAASQE